MKWHRVIAAIILSFGLNACDRFRSVETIVARGEAQYEKGNYRAALGDIKTALERDGSNLVARTYLARIYYHLADFEAAQDAINAAIASGVRDPEIIALKYRIQLARREYSEALKQVSSETSLSEAQRLLIAGQAQAGLGEFAEAAALFERSLSLAPDDVATLVAQGRLFAVMGQPERAADSVTKAMARNQNDAAAWFLKGGLLVNRGELENAKAALEKSAQLSAEQLNWYEQAQVYASLVDVALGMRNADEATRWITRLDGRAPQSPATYYLKARLALLKNNANDAVAELQKATQLGEYLPANLLLANVLLSQANYGQAEELLNKLRNTQPDNLEVRKLQAQLYLATQRYDAARQALPSETAGREDAQLDWLRGQTLFAAGSRVAGISLLEKAVGANPADSERALQLVRAYISTGEREKALRLLNQLPVNAGGAQRQSLLVLVSAMGKTPAEVRRDIDALLSRYPNDSVLHSAAGAVYALKGETKLAGDLLRKAVDLNADNLDARLALANWYLQNRQYELADAQLRAVLGKGEAAKQAQAHAALASLAFAKGDRQTAAKELELVVGAEPAAIEPRLQLAQLAILDKDMARANALLKQAVTASNNASAVANAAGQLLFQAKQYEAAQVWFDQAATGGYKTARINSAQVDIALGKTAAASRKLEMAAADGDTKLQAIALLVQQDVRDDKLDKALQRIEPLRQSKTDAKFADEMSGDAYAMAGQFAAAVANYERAAKQAPAQRLALKEYRARLEGKLTNPTAPLHAWLADHQDDATVRGLVVRDLLQNGNKAGAARELERIVATSTRRDPAVLNDLAWTYFELNDKRAEALAREAHEAAPDAAPIADTYGWILLHAGKPEQALPLLEKAAVAAKSDPEIQYHLAAAQARSGQSDKSKAILRGILASNQKFTSRTEAERLLQSLGNAGAGT